MNTTCKTTAQSFAAAAQTWTPAQLLTVYRQAFPDITPDEVAALYPLFLQATAAGQPPEVWRANLARYQAALEPIKRRQPQKRGAIML